jgi:hypothetical protein
MLFVLVAELAACGGGGGGGGTTPPASEGSATIGAAGGTVQGPDGVQLVVPPGALTDNVTIRIARSSAGAPSLSDIAPNGAPTVYEVTPHGQAFAVPVQLSFPVTGTGDYLAYAAEAGGSWSTVPATVTNGTASISRNSLSWFAVFSLGGTYCWPSIPYSCSYAAFRPATLNAPAGATAPAAYGMTAVVKPATMTITLNMVAPSPCATGAVLNVYQSQYAPGQYLNTLAVYYRRPVLTGAAVSLPNAVSDEEVGGTFPFSFNFDATNDGNNYFNFELVCNSQQVRRVATAMAVFSVEIPATPSAPVITQQPVTVAVATGSPATFTVQATAPHTLSVDWQRSADNGATFNSLGVTTPSYTLSSASLADNGALFRAHLCDVGTQQTCVDSANALLTVTAVTVVPTFTTQPTSLSVVAGQTASVTVSATGAPPPRIQIYQGAPTSGAVVQTCAAPGSGSSNTCTYTSAMLSASQSGIQFYAVADNTAGTVTSNTATITVTSSAMAPSITTQPAAATTSVGGSAGFNVNASGSAPLSYLWLFNGTPLTDRAAGASTSGITGSGSANLSLTNVQSADIGNYSVVVSNSVSPVTSQGAALTVTASTCSGWCTVYPAGYFNRVGFGSATTGIAVGRNIMVGTSDGGANWQLLETNITGAGVLSEFSDVAYVDANTVVVVGSDKLTGTTGVIYRSTDAGTTWTLVATSPQSPKYVAFSGNFGLAATYNTLLRTTDGGVTWTTITPGYSINAIVLDPTGFALADVYNPVSKQYEMLHSSDVGLTWTLIAPITGMMAWTTRLSFPAVGFGPIGNTALIGRTNDQGAHWSIIDTGLAGYFNDVLFTNQNVGLAVGVNGVIARSVDAGYTWSSISSGTSATLRGIASPSPGIFVVVGDGLILRNVQSGAGQ